MKKLLYLVLLLVLICPVLGAIRLPTNTATILTVGPFFDATNGVTPETTMTVTNITCELYKDSDAGAAPTRTAITLAASGSNNDMALITDSASGCYSLELTAAQLNFVGRARLVLIDTDVMCPWWVDIVVEPANVYNSLVAGSTYLKIDLQTALGSAFPQSVANFYNDLIVGDASGHVTIADGSLTAAKYDSSTVFAQTGDSYAIVNSVTYGLSVIETWLKKIYGEF